MRVDVFINRMAGNVDVERLRKEIHQALFRCQTHFWFPDTIEKLHAEVRARVVEGTDGLVFCGGDGTVNTALHPLMSLKHEGKELPACCVIPVGTANDLASFSGVSRRIGKAARVLLEGRPKPIDILEIRTEDALAYMVTNGGIGLAADTAHNVNRLKSAVKSRAQDESSSVSAQILFSATQWAIRGLGPTVYDLAVIKEMMAWKSSNWKIRVSVPNQTTYMTRSAMLLISNQPTVGGNFTTAAFTRNDDGKFNVLICEPGTMTNVVRSVVEMRRGLAPSSKKTVQFETDVLVLEAVNGSRPMRFFGDGEILFHEARRLEIRCIEKPIAFWVSSEDSGEGH